MTLLRYIVAIPHYIWLGLFRLFLLISLPFNWIFTVVKGRQPMLFYEFTSGYIRYRSDFVSYLTVMADPYPGFAAVRSYPVETWVPSHQEASRVSLALRPLLVIPALIVVHLAEWLLVGVAIVNFVVGLVLGRVPYATQRLGLWALRLMGETSGYGYLIQAKYPSIMPRQGERF